MRSASLNVEIGEVEKCKNLCVFKWFFQAWRERLPLKNLMRERLTLKNLMGERLNLINLNVEIGEVGGGDWVG